MKIGICGSQSSGKSTLAKALAERLGLPLIAEQARLVARSMGAYSEEMLRSAPPEVAQEFQRRCLQQQQRAEAEKPDGFVSDRTVLDNACYWLTWNHARANIYERYSYLTRCREHAMTYDLIVYCPPLPRLPEDDGFRMTNPVYRDEIDLLIRTLLIGWEIPRWVTVEGDPNQRLARALEAVQAVQAVRVA